jgi:hypothetical protein
VPPSLEQHPTSSSVLGFPRLKGAQFRIRVRAKIEPMRKTCSRCGKRKPLDAFYKQAGGAQGRRSRCKTLLQGTRARELRKDPKVQAARRRLVERWREEGLSL